MEVESIVEKVVQFGNRHVVLTGGEPMLFEPIEELSRSLHRHGHAITFETAGTIWRQVECDLMSISPKLANSDPPNPEGVAKQHRSLRQDRSAIIKLMEHHEFQLKFVVDPDSGLGDLAEIEVLLSELGGVPAEHVMIMAEGTDSESLRRRELLLVDACIERGWRLTPRFHIDLFGNRRGV